MGSGGEDTGPEDMGKYGESFNLCAFICVWPRAPSLTSVPALRIRDRAPGRGWPRTSAGGTPSLALMLLALPTRVPSHR
eukprot:3684306-Pyramimonas_sp.AAC.1